VSRHRAGGFDTHRCPDATIDGMAATPYRYRRDERRPVEVLVLRVDPAHVEEFLRIDHDVWTLGEAFADAPAPIPFLSKEVWLDDSRPGEVTLVFVWESMAAWRSVDTEELQRTLQQRFDEAFPHDVTLVRAVHEEHGRGIHRWSRFERLVPDS
jgi:uncharacterized protein (TIGR03792 family)